MYGNNLYAMGSVFSPDILKPRNLRSTVRSTIPKKTEKDDFPAQTGEGEGDAIDKIIPREIRSSISYAWHIDLLLSMSQFPVPAEHRVEID